ncbi:MAG TPA: DUF2334 domain-containing protein [Longimicrobiales bacterium]|nr:DUF2334 domain-containing protein [Longimicrobiales bacterium]
MLRSRSTRTFVVCIHDATPAYARETRILLRDLAPLVGRRISLGVVPDWHGAWPLASHPDYCRLVQERSQELLLHGYHHRRARGYGPASWLAERSDEMNGLDRGQTLRTLERGQRVFSDVFGEDARGFLAPAWQPGHVHSVSAHELGLDHVIGFLSLRSCTGRRIPLATWTWDCGRWGWLGHVGHGIGALLHSIGNRIPILAVHPRDIERGFMPVLMRLIRELLHAGYEPGTVAGLLETGSAPAAEPWPRSGSHRDTGESPQ